MKRIALSHNFFSTVDDDYFTHELDAAKARDKRAQELFGSIAHLNFPL